MHLEKAETHVLSLATRGQKVKIIWPTPKIWVQDSGKRQATQKEEVPKRQLRP